MKTDRIHTATSTATVLRAQLQDANAEAVHSNPLAAIMLLDLIGQAAQIAQRLSEITNALDKTS